MYCEIGCQSAITSTTFYLYLYLNSKFTSSRKVFVSVLIGFVQHRQESINNCYIRIKLWTHFGVCLCRGQQHPIKIKCCKHEPEALTLVRNGFWPFSPKQPQVAFDLGFMALLQYIFLESGGSLKSICQALQWLVPPASKVYISIHSVIFNLMFMNAIFF